MFKLPKRSTTILTRLALTWIEKRGKWSVFVENRVKDINSSTKPSQWEHVPDHANPADLLSRGCNPTQLN